MENNKNKSNQGQPRVVRGSQPTRPQQAEETATRQFNTSAPSQSRVVRGTAPSAAVQETQTQAARPIRTKKKMSTVKKVLIIVASSFGAIFLAFAALFFYYFGGLNTNDLDVPKGDLNINPEIVGKYGKVKIVNIAFFGIDTRSDDNKGRSDAIMILSIDNEHNKIKLTSIARDTYVTIPGRQNKDKINHAYSFGGPELAIKTLNYNFGLDIQDYVTVNFYQLAEVIDAVGGVDVDISKAEMVEINRILLDTKITGHNLKTFGDQHHLNGTQAVAFSRIRAIGGDTERTDRQREVLNCMFAKVKGMKTIEYPGIVKKMLPMVTTSLNYTDIIGLSPIMLKGDIPLEQTSFPHALNKPKGQTINGTWYYVYDTLQATDILHKFIYEDVHPDLQAQQQAAQ